MKPLMLLVDGSSYLYRAYHAMPDLRSPNGFPTGAVHGMVAMMRRLRDQYPAEHAACVFDASGPTFRDEWYPEYKGHRAPMPEPLVQQIEPIHEVVRLLGWPVLQVGGIEADDVIGTIARQAAASGHRVLISTGDKDLAQLVTPDVSLVNTMSNESLDEAGVLAKFGVPPDRIIDYLTLMGDAVDNVPGVEKVGPKTAAKWIAEHGSLDGVIAAAASIKGVAGENLRKVLDWLPMGRRLVTVKCDCDLSADVAQWPALEALALQSVNQTGLHDFFQRYGFRTWLRELDAQGVRGSAAGPAEGSAAGASAATGSSLFGEANAAGSGAVPGSGSSSGSGSGSVRPPALHRLGAQAYQAAGADESDAQPIPPLTEPVGYETITTWAQFDDWMARVRAAPLVAFDTETDSLDPMAARLVGLSVSVTPGQAAYLPLHHDYADVPTQLPAAEVLQRLRPWLEDETAPKLGQNIKYDLHVMANAGVTVRGYVHDTLLQSYVLEAHRPHSLESLADRHLGRRGLSYEDVCGKGAHQIPFSQVDLEKATRYSGEDSDMTLHVHQVLWPRLQRAPGLQHVYGQIELPCAVILQRMERHGVLVDAAVLQQQSRELGERIMALEQQAYEIAGQPFNLGSPKQIGEILFNRLGLPVKKKTATGAPSTDEEVLQELAADYPLPAKLLEHRSLSKLKSTYTDKLPQMINSRTGRVHTSYQQAVAVTGRLSSNEPNLQNIPIRTAEGRRIREAFIAPPGHVLMSADYSQIELRIMAHISEDPGLLRAFAEGQDVHKATASEVFGVPVSEVSSEQRRYAKVINFGLIYGMGAFGLASNLGIEQKAARDYIDRYFARFAGVKRYMDETKAQAAERGYVETVFGRRLYLPEIRGGNGPRRSAAERQAINAPMQGTAADLIKLAMMAVQKALDEENRATRMVMQVHDELVLEVPDAEVPWAQEALPRLMAGVAELKVPLLAEVGTGPNWDKAH